MADFQGNFMNALKGGYQFGQQVKQQQDQSNFNRLAGQAYSAPQEQRPQLLGQMAGINPQAAREQQKAFEMDDERRDRIMVNMAKTLTGAPEQSRPSLWKSFLPMLSRFGMSELPQDYNEQTAPVINQAAQSLVNAYGGGQQQRNLAISPGSAIVDPDSGQVIYERPFAPAKENWQLENVPDGTGGMRQMERNPATGEWRLPQYPGQGPSAPSAPGTSSTTQQPAQFGIPETDNYVRSILAKVGPVDPNASPEQLAEQLLPHLIQQESGGDPNAVSPKGAQGLTQVMPATGQNPGFGVAPLQGNSPEENVRFGRDYLTAMLHRYPGRVDLALAAYNAGPGRVDKLAGGTTPPGGGGLGSTPPKQSGVRPATPQEIAALGLPDGTSAQIDTEGRATVLHKPEKPSATSDGLNERQRVAVQGVQRNLIQYAAALTGKTPEDLRALTSDEIAKLIEKGGSRFMQGGVARLARNLPGGQTMAEVQNADILSYSQGAGAAWAAYENPTGIITNADRETATAQMPNLYDPPQVQAAKIKNFLELSGWGKQQASAQPGGQPQRRGNQPGSVPPQAVEFLKENPALRQQFEQKYGVSADDYLR